MEVLPKSKLLIKNKKEILFSVLTSKSEEEDRKEIIKLLIKPIDELISNKVCNKILSSLLLLVNEPKKDMSCGSH